MNNLSNILGTLQKFQQFASTFNGDPKQAASRLMNSGKYTKEQIEQAKKMATQMESIMNTFGGFKGV